MNFFRRKTKPMQPQQAAAMYEESERLAQSLHATVRAELQCLQDNKTNLQRFARNAIEGGAPAAIERTEHLFRQIADDLAATRQALADTANVKEST
jgi:hypothetical protein